MNELLYLIKTSHEVAMGYDECAQKFLVLQLDRFKSYFKFTWLPMNAWNLDKQKNTREREEEEERER